MRLGAAGKSCQCHMDFQKVLTSRPFNRRQSRQERLKPLRRLKGRPTRQISSAAWLVSEIYVALDKECLRHERGVTIRYRSYEILYLANWDLGPTIITSRNTCATSRE
jgi:hypothetical protein